MPAYIYSLLRTGSYSLAAALPALRFDPPDCGLPLDAAGLPCVHPLPTRLPLPDKSPSQRSKAGMIVRSGGVQG